MSDGKRVIKADEFIIALCAAGVIGDPADTIQRVVIDAPLGSLVTIHVQHHGDERLLTVAQGLDGVQIERAS